MTRFLDWLKDAPPGAKTIYASALALDDKNCSSEMLEDALQARYSYARGEV
jgi:hypothetical protein